MKFVVLIAVPPGVITAIGPDDATEDTIAVMVVAFTTVNDSAGDPVNITAVAPRKFVPVIVTTVSIPPLVGENEVMVGASEEKVNVPLLVAVPPKVVAVIFPVAPLPTVAVSAVRLTTV